MPRRTSYAELDVTNAMGQVIQIDEARIRELVELYANSSGLHQPVETYAFDRFVPQGGASILDIGVGGGRTTPYLAARGSRYVGID